MRYIIIISIISDDIVECCHDIPVAPLDVTGRNQLIFPLQVDRGENVPAYLYGHKSFSCLHFGSLCNKILANAWLDHCL